MRKPRFGAQTMALEISDLLSVVKRESNVIQAMDQAVLSKGLHLKGDLLALRSDDHLTLQINGQLIANEARDFVKELVDRALGQDDGQQAVFEAIVKKDVSITWRQYGPKAILINGPRGMFA